MKPCNSKRGFESDSFSLKSVILAFFALDAFCYRRRSTLYEGDLAFGEVSGVNIIEHIYDQMSVRARYTQFS
jgi:hypothetical protein